MLQAGRYVVTSRVGGIPDIYEARPDLGVMVNPEDKEAMAEGLEDALRRIQSNAIDQGAMRAHYEQHFSIAVAHRAWTRALNIALPA